jgi:hypothetical protein
MSPKKLIWIGLIVGSTAGGYVPTLFGVGLFSLWSVVGSTVGGVAGIVAGYKLGQWMGV